MKKKKNRNHPGSQDITRKDFFKKSGKALLSLTGIPALASAISCSYADNQAMKNLGMGTVSLLGMAKNKSTIDITHGVTPNTVYLAKNGDCFQNINKLFEMMGGITKFIDPTDVVVIKGNGQWAGQGYTHTGCIKAVIDQILAIPGYSGEIFICDNVQTYGSTGQTGFDATFGSRFHNWPDHNWDSLAAEYQAAGKKVTSKKWICKPSQSATYSGPGDGEGWIRYRINDFHGHRAFLSYPIFQSDLVAGRFIDMKNGVWEGGAAGHYTTRKVKAIFMPTLNNHGENGNEDYAGVTSAIKSFYGATEINGIGVDLTVGSLTYNNIHTATFNNGGDDGSLWAGELAAHYINNLYAPVLYITTAMWSGWQSRQGEAAETKTVLACTNPATLDYIACLNVISPFNSKLNPNNLLVNTKTRKQILGCISGGVGSITPGEFSTIEFDFNV